MNDTSVAIQRLHNQGLLTRPFGAAADVVNWLVASQAQDFSGAKWSLALRMRAAVDRSVEQAFSDGTILRTHLLRPTWHFVTPADIRWLLMLTAPRVLAASASYHKKVELTDAVFVKAERVLARALEGGKQLAREDVRELLERNRILTKGELRFSYLLMHAELRGVICSGAKQGKLFTYALLDERAPRARRLERDAARAELVYRFFMSRGPATIQDFVKWSWLTLTDARAGLADVRRHLREEIRGGTTFWMSPDLPEVVATPPKVWLLSIYDEFVSSYKSRSEMVSPRLLKHLATLGNDLTGIVVLNGQIVGTWKRALRKSSVSMQTDVALSLKRNETKALREAIEQYAAFLELDLENAAG